MVGQLHEVFGRRPNGSTIPVELVVSQVEGGSRLFSGILRDITVRSSFDAQLGRHALHDPLTCLGNRTVLLDCWTRSWRDGPGMAVCCRCASWIWIGSSWSTSRWITRRAATCWLGSPAG